ncbi:hypothetical protein FGG78_13690 [Thioclava sp. BHET1]|nr:hypothetical protein FGG78_13690 [Thioclava sp. BHET1]
MDKSNGGSGASTLLQELIERDHTRDMACQPVQGVVSQGARIYTLDGVLPVEFLGPGDRIVTRSGARVLRELRYVDYVGPLIHVAPGALGHDRPGAPLLMHPEARLLLRDWRCEVIYGTKEALVQASALVDGQYVTSMQGRARLFHLTFDTPEVITVDGVEVAMAPETVRV